MQPSALPTTEPASPTTSPTSLRTKNPTQFPSMSPITSPSSQPTASQIGEQSIHLVKGDVLAFSRETVLLIAGCMLICCAGVFLFLCRSACFKAKPGQSLATDSTRHGSTVAAEGSDSPLPQFDCESGGALTPNLESIWTGPGSPILYRSNDVKYLDMHVQSEQQIEGRSETNNETTEVPQQIL